MDVAVTSNSSSNNLDLDLEDDADVDLAPLYQAGSQYISTGCPLISDPQVVVPVLLGLAATGFLLNSAILASILSSRLLLRTREQDK